MDEQGLKHGSLARLAAWLSASQSKRRFIAGILGWWLVIALSLCGPASSFDEPYMHWDSIVRGIWSGLVSAAVAAAFLPLPPSVTAIGIHALLRHRDRREGRTARDRKPLCTFLMASWLLAPPLAAIAPFACISNGLNELIDFPGHDPGVPVWAYALRFSPLCYPATLVVTVVSCLLLACRLASLAPITLSLRHSIGCPRCGYLRVGLPDDVPCPECGSSAPIHLAQAPPKPALLRCLHKASALCFLLLIATVLALAYASSPNTIELGRLFIGTFEAMPELSNLIVALFLLLFAATLVMAGRQDSTGLSGSNLNSLWRLLLAALIPMLAIQVAHNAFEQTAYRQASVSGWSVERLRKQPTGRSRSRSG